MSTIRITGGKPLGGIMTPIPNKNSILKIIPACILADGPVLIKNVPQSSAVRILLMIFKDLGGKVSYPEKGSVKLDGRKINKFQIEDSLAMKERSSFLFLGPLLARFGQASIRDGGGCKLGNRPLDTMFKGLEELGVQIDDKDGYKMFTKGLKGAKIWLLEASVTGTENLVLAAVKTSGITEIYNAACEPHTQDLCNFLNSIGARIQGVGTNKIVINGVEKLSGGEWTIIPDHIDIGGLIVAAAVTGGELRIKNAIPNHMIQIINHFEKLNLKVIIEGEDIFIPKNQKLIAKKNFKGDIDKIVDQPWPGFPADLIPQALILSLMAEGSIRIYSNMYEVQLIELFAELFKMNSKMILTNPNQILTLGPTNFNGTKVNASTILQCTHALLLAGLASKGTTIIKDSDIIYRRFPDIIKTLTVLGANIESI